MFGVTMNGYHAHLVLHNLTTNEHINKSRYHYLKDDMGRFRNPFDFGFLGNIADFWTRDRAIDVNPYHYTELYQGRQPDGRPPKPPQSPAMSCNEDDELIGAGNDVEAGGRPAA
jgi:hypothetical protein